MSFTSISLPDYRVQTPEAADRFSRIRERPVVLKINNLRKTFGTEEGMQVAFENVSLDVHRREFICIIGPSGCGKSTLIRIVAGLDHATGGEMLVDGHPVSGPGQDRGMV